MFEKEAEERTEENYACNKKPVMSLEAIDYKKGFQDGAEFGYNKGKNEAIKHLKDLVYIVELGKNELATARIAAEAKEFLKETK